MSRLKGSKAKIPSTLESRELIYGKSCDVFYTHKKDKDITAIATYYKRKVKTENMVIVSVLSKTPSASRILKVTLL